MPTREEILIQTILAGEREFVAGATAEAAALGEVGVASEATGRAFERTAKRGFIMNQALFTMRRVAYAGTLAILATGVAAVRLGWSYNQAMQQARVALAPVFDDQQALTDQLTRLYNFTKYTPFQFKDVTTAFRQMYGAFQPLGISLAVTNETIHAMTDALAFVGRTTPGALNRVAVALQHMAFQGRLTGQTTLQLARDGLPVYAALHKELGLTAEQMHKIGQLGIPAEVALNAINRYIETTPGYAEAARRQALGTVHGLFTTVRDDIAQISGAVQQGLFHRIQGGLVNFLRVLDDMSVAIQRTGGSLSAMLAVLDAHLTPGSHGVLLIWHQLYGIVHNFWILFAGLMHDLTHSTLIWGTVYLALVLLHTVLAILSPQVHVLGHFLALLIPVWIVWVTYLKLSAIWTAVNTTEEILFTRATKQLTFAQFLLATMMGRYQLAAKLSAAATAIYEGALLALSVAGREATLALFTLQIVAMTNPFVLLVTAVVLLTTALVILYFKWDAFHNLVNETFRFLWTHWPIAVAVLVGTLGPLGLIIAAVVTLIRYWQDVVRWATAAGHAMQRAAHWFSGGGATNALLAPFHYAHIPGFAAGGITPGGPVWVGERGPELLWPPRGSQVSSGEDIKPIFNRPEAWMGKSAGKPLVIQVMLDRRVLAEAMVDDIETAGARA